MGRTENIDWAALMPDVARRLLGEPASIKNSGNTWRYRRRGSLAVHVGGTGGLKGTWSDWESGHRGGVLELIERERGCDRAAAMAWLECEGLIPAKSDRRRTGAPSSQAAQEPAERQSPASTSTPTRTEKDRLAIAYAGQLWDAGVSADDTPGRGYLAWRWVWPGVDVAGSPDLPQAIRWLSRQAAGARDPETGKPLLWLPPGADGALLFAFTDADGNVVAVHFEALTETGELVSYTDPAGQQHERYRQTRGPIGGTYMQLGRCEEPGGCLVVVEGPIDALAAWWLWPNAAAVWSGAGTGGLGSFQPKHVAGFDKVLLAADGDRAGQEAMLTPSERLINAGISVDWWDHPSDYDPARLLSENLDERAAIIEFDSEQPRAKAEALAWSPHRTPLPDRRTP